MSVRLQDTLLRKQTRLTALAVCGALLVTILAIGFYEQSTFLPRALAHARSQAAITSEIMIPALEFDDSRTATRLLEVLRHEDTVEVAAVYRLDGTLLASYRQSPGLPPPPARVPATEDGLVGPKIEVVAPVLAVDGPIGRIWLQIALPGWWERAQQYFLMLLTVAFSVTVLSIFVTYAIRRQITDPVHALVETVRRIGESRDLSLRVPEEDQGEVGQLATSFNTMLAAINERDRLMVERDARLVRQNAGLAQLARRELTDPADFEAALREFIELVAEGQQTERVSVWLFDEQKTALGCIDLLELAAKKHSAGARLLRSEYSFYFQTLEADQTIIAADALTDVRTREFVDSYLRPLGIGAMLDAPIRWRGQLVGVLCHEHVGGRREWYADEAAFAEVVAEQIAHLLERRESLRIEAARRDSDTRFRDFISQAQDAIFTLSLDGRIQSVNDAARRITGWELNTWIGHRFQRVLLPTDVALAEQRFAAVIRGEVPPSFELRIRTRSGGLATLEFVVSPQREGGRVVGLLGIGRDVSERKQAAEARLRLEEQLRHSQKMEAIGTMAGGIAHDFNNILTAIIGNAQIAEMDLDRQHPAHTSLLQVLIASHRAKELVQQILAFSRRQDQRLLSTSLVQVVAEALKLLRPVIAATIQIKTRLPERVAPILADATQLHQVVVNLATNAAHAMETKGGCLELVVEEIEIDDAMATLKPGLKPGPHVRLSVTDDGIGMSPAVQAKIFDPFFTTKEKGKGTGLGLAVVHGIVQQHGGAITIYSVPGEGTTFQVYLPVAVNPSERPDVEVVHPVMNGGGETILVVDDEVQVTAVAATVLERCGFRVEKYNDPVQALAAVQAQPSGWSLVITDQLMPVMKGTTLAGEIWKIAPTLPVLLATGFAGNLDEVSALRSGLAGFLQKPFTREALLQAVARALQRPR